MYLLLIRLFACVEDIKVLYSELDTNYKAVSALPAVDTEKRLLFYNLSNLSGVVYKLVDSNENLINDLKVRRILAISNLLQNILLDKDLEVFLKSNMSIDDWINSLLRDYELNESDFLLSGLDPVRINKENDYFVANLKNKIGELLVELSKSNTLNLSEKFENTEDVFALINETYSFLEKIKWNYPEHYSIPLIYYNDFNENGEFGGKSNGRTILRLQELLQHIALNYPLVFSSLSVLKLNILTRNFELPYFRFPSYNGFRYLDNR